MSKPINGAFIRYKVWYKILRRVGLRAVRLHDRRHSYASLLLQAGEPMIYVKEQLGHSSINVTVDLYGHVRPGAHGDAVDRLAAAAHAVHSRGRAASPEAPWCGERTGNAAW